MKDFNQFFFHGLDYVMAAIRNWDARRSRLIASYIETSAFTHIRNCKDKHYLLIRSLEERIDEALFEYRFYVRAQKEIDNELRAMGIQVEK